MDQLKFFKNYIRIKQANNISINKKDLNFEYITEKEGIYNIFGKIFVLNNKDNVELIINIKFNKLVDKLFY